MAMRQRGGHSRWNGNTPVGQKCETTNGQSAEVAVEMETDTTVETTTTTTTPHPRIGGDQEKGGSVVVGGITTHMEMSTVDGDGAMKTHIDMMTPSMTPMTGAMRRKNEAQKTLEKKRMSLSSDYSRS